MKTQNLNMTNGQQNTLILDSTPRDSFHKNHNISGGPKPWGNDTNFQGSSNLPDESRPEGTSFFDMDESSNAKSEGKVTPKEMPDAMTFQDGGKMRRQSITIL